MCPPQTFITLVIASAYLMTAVAAEEEVTDAQLQFFETKIRPALADACYQCHASDQKIRGGLTLDTKVGSRIGGDSGPAIVPGDLEASLLWTAINWEDDYEMPPKRMLPPDVIEDFRQWILMGAPDPRITETTVVASGIDIEKGKTFWAFQKPVATPAPAVQDKQWPFTETDHFILTILEKNDLRPAPDASPETLLRRIYFDLIGLPPTADEIRAYADAWKQDPERAYREKVTALLASPHFGERWGRHWLDVARYAESSGKEVNMTYPHAWRYRDYVIDAFNNDKPYDLFLSEQIAGDLLPAKDDADWQENLIATGFLAIGPKGLNERNPRQFALDMADEQVDATTQAMLGLTIACARCHDHKSDPIPTADYYALSGIFQSTRTLFGTINAVQNRRGTKLLELPIPDETTEEALSLSKLTQLRTRLASTNAELIEIQTANRRARAAGESINARAFIRLRSAAALLSAQIGRFDENGKARTVAMGTQDLAVPVVPKVLLRGELDKPAQEIPRGFPQVLYHSETPEVPASASGRREFAIWMTSEENPLTARVMVNRVWAHLFGQGIVASPNNFGATGKPPSHPELLDTLAVRFMESGWSIKTLIHSLVTSHTYRMNTQHTATAFEKDPNNTLLWRHTPRRLDAEALRDAMLVASGELSAERPRGSIVAETGNAQIGRRTTSADLDRAANYRSVYLPAARDALPESLALFDPAEPNTVTGTREETNVPGQALYLMNDPFVIGRAKALAGRIREQSNATRTQITEAFFSCYGRPPTTEETNASLSFLRTFEMAADATPEHRKTSSDTAFYAFCQSLLASAEFRYLD